MVRKGNVENDLIVPGLYKIVLQTTSHAYVKTYSFSLT